MREHQKQTAEVTGTIDEIAYTLQIPQEAVNSLLLGQPWSGEVNIGPKRDRQPRKASARTSAIINQSTKKSRFKATVRATVEERRVIRAWNRSRYIRGQERSSTRESRNFPLAFNKIKEALTLVRKAIKTVGAPQVIVSIESYFDFCSGNGHIWDGSNHGYKTLTGFLEKLIKIAKAKETSWWDSKDSPTKPVEDKNPKLTKRIADSFAQTFMDEEKFILEEGSKEHRFFVKSSAQIVSYISRKKRQGIELTQKELIFSLLEYVMELFGKSDTPVYPSHLASSAIWSAFPQYLQEKGLI